MTIVENVIEALYEGSGDRSFADTLGKVLQEKLEDLRDTEWKTVVATINTELRYWLLSHSHGKRSDDRLDKKIHAARNSLALPDREHYIEFWLADLRLDYAPVAHSLF